MKKSFLLSLCVLACSFAFALTPITGPGHVCSSGTITLANATAGGVWSSSTPSLASIDASTGVVTAGSGSGTVTITYTLGTDVTTVVTVDPSPAPITGISSFCNYIYTDTLRCTTPGGIWADYSIHDSVSTAGVLYHTGSCGGGCGYDTITYTLSTGCKSSFIVTLNPLVVVYFPPSVCVGSVEMAYGTPSTGVWSGGTPGVATISGTGTIFGTSIGSGAFTYSLMGCVYPYFTTHVVQGIYEHYINYPPDTVCDSPDFFISACGTGGAYSVVTHFGDGEVSTTSFGSGTSAHVYHAYNFPGTYGVKQVLYNGAVAMDSVTFSYEHHYCRTLPLKMYNDNNGNGVFDAGDTYAYLAARLRVDSNGVPIDTFSVSSGGYRKADGPTGTIYSFTVIDGPGGMLVTSPASGTVYDTISAIVNNYPVRYIGFTCNPSSGFDFDIYSSVTCGRHTALVDVIVGNGYCTPASATVTVQFSPKYGFLEATPAPLSVVGNTVTWDAGVVTATSSSPGHIRAHFERPVPWLIPGDTVHSSFMVSPTTGDVNPSNNSHNRVDTVRASFDPNEIEVSPQGYIPSASTQLRYTVHFENMGNDTAHNIYVLDTLPSYVDVKSLQVLAASAVMNVAPMKVAGLNIIKFDFPGINLPDTSHHGLSSGMFVYTVRTIGGLAPGTVIPNRAGIYFDDNEVVMTNTVNNIIETPPSVSVQEPGGKVVIYPNPAHGVLVIESDATAHQSFAISNSIGQVLLNGNIAGQRNAIDVSSLPAGLYYVTVRGQAGTVTRKFVKE